MSEPVRNLFEFGEFQMDIGERLLVKQGTPVSLTPKAFDILAVLVQRSGHLFKKEELLTLVWNDSFVEESNLTRNIYLLRKALGEGPNGNSYIETVPRKGYRFVANVRVVSIPDHFSLTSEDQTHPEPERQEFETPAIPEEIFQPGRVPRRWFNLASNFRFLVAVAMLSALSVSIIYVARSRIRKTGDKAKIRTIAILPFKSIDTQSSDKQMGLGMADAIIGKFSRVAEVIVLPTSAVFNYVGGTRDPRSVGSELGVDAVLDGTIQRSEDQIRVSVQLVDVHSGRVLWSKNFDQTKTEIFEVQDLLAEEVARTLLPEITDKQTYLLTKRLTENPAAYDAYSMGLHFWNRRSKENLPKAIIHFEAATKFDPHFARAYAYLADCYSFGVLSGTWLQQADAYWPKTQAAVARSLELDETTPEAHTVAAFVKEVNKDFAGASREHQRALELDPNFATGHLRYSYHLFNQLRLLDAISEMKRAQELDPLSPVTNVGLSFMLTMAGRNDEAIKFARRALELQPEMLAARATLNEAYVSRNRFQEAVALFESPALHETVTEQLCFALAQASAGRQSEARVLIANVERAVRRNPNLVTGDSEVPYSFAIVCLTLGELDKALEWLDRVRWSRFMTAKLNFDPQLAVLRSNPRFEDFLRRQKIVLGVPAPE